MKIIILIQFLCLYSLENYCQIEGRILSEINHMPVKYASIIILDKKINGTTTDEKGHFTLRVSDKTFIYISAIGFRDTIIQAKALKQHDLMLKTKIYQLDEVTVTPTKLKPLFIGNKDAQPSKDGWLFTYPGQAHGIYYKIKKQEIGKTLHSIRFYISEHGKYNSTLGLRIMTYRQIKLLENQALPTENFYDLLPEPITYTPHKPGWQEINLSGYDLYAPANGLFIVFYPLEEGPKNQWINDKGSTCYGPFIANSIPPFQGFKFISFIPEEKKIYIISNHLAKKYIPMIIIQLK